MLTLEIAIQKIRQFTPEQPNQVIKFIEELNLYKPRLIPTCVHRSKTILNPFCAFASLREI